MLVVASDPFAISTMAHAQYDILPFLDKTRASSFFALSSLFIPQTSICASLKAIFNALFVFHTRTTRRWNDCSFQPRQLP